MARVSKRLRYEILRRDQFKCRYCGVVAAEAELRVDHVIPEALGGTSEPSNLAAACDPCNSGKSSVPPDAAVVDDVAQGALRWSAAMQAAARMKEQEIEERNKLNNEFLVTWSCYRLTESQEEIPLPDDWDSAVHRLRAVGLSDALTDEAVAVAMKAYNVLPENRFRYFCGVAWNIVSQLQKAAQDILTDGEPRTVPAVRGDLDQELIARAVDDAMDNSGIYLDPWKYDELVIQLAQKLLGRATADAPN